MKRIASYRNLRDISTTLAYSISKGIGFFFCENSHFYEKGKPIVRWGRKDFWSLKEDSLTIVKNETNTFRAFDSSLLGHVILLSIPKREVIT